MGKSQNPGKTSAPPPPPGKKFKIALFLILIAIIALLMWLYREPLGQLISGWFKK